METYTLIIAVLFACIICPQISKADDEVIKDFKSILATGIYGQERVEKLEKTIVQISNLSDTYSFAE